MGNQDFCTGAGVESQLLNTVSRITPPVLPPLVIRDRTIGFSLLPTGVRKIKGLVELSRSELAINP
jgi:hypothetical protein